MSEITTVTGFPKNEPISLDFFKPIGCQVNQPFYKASFMDDYGMYCAMNGIPAMLSTDGIRIVLVKDKKETPLMYAYIIEWDKEYTLMEIGRMQVYEVDKKKIEVEEVEYHRLPFICSRKGLFIAVRNNKDEEYVQELWFRDAKTEEETKLEFPGGNMKEGYEYLKEQGLLN